METQEVNKNEEITPVQQVQDPVDLTPVRKDVQGNIDLEATLNKIRSEEKRKHQSDIERYKKESEEKAKRLMDIETELKKFQDAGKSDMEKALSQVQELTSKYSETEKMLIDLKLQNQAKDLELYKVKKLMGAGSDLIPELVAGSTPEEIDLSIDMAKAKYKEIVAKIQSQTQQQIQQINSVASPSNPPSINSRQDKIGVDGMDVSAMSLEEYKKNRDALKNVAFNQAKKSLV